MYSSRSRIGTRGVTLLDTLVGLALMLVVFVGIAGAFQLSLDVVLNNKARAGAIALADQRMEYIRSLSYSALGTVGGVPSGTIAQSEALTLNGIRYTRRTFIEYEDDPKDGSGASDTNAIPEDYKSAKVDVAWTFRTGTRHVTVVTRVTPTAGLETNVPGGTLSIASVNALGQALAGASVSIVNAGASPAVNINTFTDASGTAVILGAPSASGYQITVSEPGYSTSQTYSVTAQNTNPSPGNVTVTNNHTTSSTFAIDVLGSKTISTWTQIVAGTWTDAFSDASKIATSSNVTVTGGVAKLSGSSPYFAGEVQSLTIGPSYLSTWNTLSWVDTEPAGTTIRYRVYDGNSLVLIPDAQIPGNSTGFTTSPISLSGVSTSTYPSLRIDATLSPSSTQTPTLDSWTVAYTYGPQPLPNIAFTLQGAKTIGTGPSGTIYKYTSTLSTGSASSITVPNLEWDNYTVSIGSATGYDIASACNPQPESLSPGAALSTSLYLAAHTTNSLLVDVRSTASGALVPGATVKLTRTGFSATSTADTCGQAFFSNLTSSGAYSVTTAKTGFTTATTTGVTVSGTSRKSITF